MTVTKMIRRDLMTKLQNKIFKNAIKLLQASNYKKSEISNYLKKLTPAEQIIFGKMLVEAKNDKM